MKRRYVKKNKLVKKIKTLYKSVFKTYLRFYKKTKRKFKKVDYDYVLARTAFVSLVVIIWFSGPSFIGITTSYYNDVETSHNNLQAGVVDIEVLNGDLDTLESSLSFGSGTTTKKQIQVQGGPQSSPFIYHASTTDVLGDLSFCNDLSLDISLNGNPWQVGSTTTFVSATTTLISTSTPDLWDITFNTLSASSTPNSVCTFNFTYNAVQNSDPVLGGGFVDSEVASTTIYSWGLRINKVYYDVDSPKRGTDKTNEWVEIYNQTDTDIDMTGWKICDNTSCDTIPTSDPIPAKGFAVITPDKSTWDYWQRADGVVSIVLGNLIGNGLANTADMLVLKRPDGMIIDQMNWGTPDTTWVNYKDNLWNPGALDVPKGSTLGRKPNGYDTNSPSDFVKLSPPVLNLIYPDQSGTLTWYWTYNYNITWTATNPNGNDSDLLIDLAFIKDTDGSSSPTPLDEEVSIGKRLSNTGSYNWQVPSGFLGYIWLKIVAFGPENPMLNTKMNSGKIYDPAPMQILLTKPEEDNSLEQITGALTPVEEETPKDSEDDLPKVEESENAVPEESIETKEVSLAPEEVLKPESSPDEPKPEGSSEEQPLVSPKELAPEPLPEDLDKTVTEVKEESNDDKVIISPETEPLVLPEAEPEPVVDNPAETQ